MEATEPATFNRSLPTTPYTPNDLIRRTTKLFTAVCKESSFPPLELAVALHRPLFHQEIDDEQNK